MYTEFCRGCVNYTIMDDGTELCLNGEVIDIHDLKVCPVDGITEAEGRLWVCNTNYLYKIRIL